MYPKYLLRAFNECLLHIASNVVCQVRYVNFVAINFRLHRPSSSFASILFVSAWPLWPICRQHDPWQILLELETWAQHLHPKHEELMPWRIRKCQSVKKTSRS